MKALLRFTAIGQHISEYPDPVSFSQGAHLIIHERYEGEEGWEGWYYCTIPGHPGGWVPEQLLERFEGTYRGIAKEDYTARELEVKTGDEVIGMKSLNGWIWCERVFDGATGWVPLALLHEHHLNEMTKSKI